MPFIDDEFASLLPPASETSGEELERQLLENEGPRDPILVWQEKPGANELVIDGHRRLAICIKHGLPFQTDLVQLPDRTAVKRWICQNQLARRNLTRHGEELTLAKLREIHERAHGKRGSAQRAAKEAGVDRRTVYRATEYDKACKHLAPEIRDQLDSGGLADLSRKNVVDLAKQAPEDQPAMLREMRAPGEQSPLAKLFEEAYRRLGRLKSALDDLGRAKPGPEYEQAMVTANKLDRWLTIWKEAD